MNLKKFICFIIIFTMIASVAVCFSGCGYDDVIKNYIYAMDAMDFEKAYDSIYKFNSSDVVLEDYVSDYKKLVNALQITDISITQYKIGTDENGKYLEYTAVYENSYTDPFEFQYKARIIETNSGNKIQYGPHLILPEMETGDRIVVNIQTGSRGEIISSDKEVLATNSYADTVYLKVRQVESINTTLSELSELIDFDVESIKKKYDTAIEREYGTVAVAAFPRNSINGDFETKLKAIKGVGIDRDYMTPARYYPYGEEMAHIVGYLGSPDEETLNKLIEQGYTSDIKVGKYGLEKTYEDTLRGKDGVVIYIVDDDGNQKSIVYNNPGEPGTDVVVTINSEIQQYAYYLLQDKLLDGQAGVAIVMDAKTGALDAMVSYPSFDSNEFLFSISEERWNELNSEENGSPLYNRATQGLYAPGSTFKPFSVTPALENGVITASSVFPYEIHNNSWIPPGVTWNYPPVKRTETTRGELNLTSAMRSSDNIFFAWAAFELGEEKFMEYMKKIGVGEAIDFELPVKSSNLLNEGTEMNVKLLTDMAFGHGELLFTPIQMISMYSALLNDGNMVQPRLTQRLCVQEGTDYVVKQEFETKYFKTDTMKTSTVETLMKTLKEVVNSGTAHPIKSRNYVIAAKTGTAVVGSANKREINWVIGFWPEIDNTKIVLVMVESKENEGTVKFDIAKPLLNPSLYNIAY